MRVEPLHEGRTVLLRLFSSFLYPLPYQLSLLDIPLYHCNTPQHIQRSFGIVEYGAPFFLIPAGNLCCIGEYYAQAFFVIFAEAAVFSADCCVF